MNRLLSLPFVAGLALLALLFVGPIAVARVAAEVGEATDIRRAAYVQSTTCRRCHPDHYDSWYRTFHRTMTQPAGPEAVLGDFNGASYTFQGVTSRFFQQNARYFIETLNTQGQLQTFEIAMTVGSRRVQQYVTRIGDRHVRLPLAWNIEERRWFHLNGGFLHPDGSDFNTHTALWDANCIFCHNVKARPGYDWNTQVFNSGVAQLGIACEACHGPGEEHITRNANPVRRYFLYLEGRDPTIISPLELSQEQQVQVCGHCHGQRLPAPLGRIEEFLAVGDPYTAGDDLNAYTTPIWHDSKLEGIDLSLRFWPDGTPRLTAYEYQAILQTKDYQEGELTCISCHNMHGGDPAGMIDEAMRGPEACLQCHEEVREDIPGHTHHLAESSGSDCYACHMPKITYGLLDVHPTHRIQRPEPARAWRYNMPEACTLCHTNQTATWAANDFSAIFEKPFPEDLPSTAEFRVAENVRALLSGDVVQRAVAVMAFSDPNSYLDDPVDRLWAVPFLILTMEDAYPAIRHFAYRSLNALLESASIEAPGAAFDPLAPPDARAAAVEAWRAWWAAFDKAEIEHPGPAVPLDARLLPDPMVVDSLLARQEDKIIEIGE